MVPRLFPGNSCEARQVVTQAEVHGGGHGKNERMLKAGSAGEDNPEELVEEYADAAAEGRAMACVKVRLIQGNQAKDTSPVTT